MSEGLRPLPDSVINPASFENLKDKVIKCTFTPKGCLGAFTSKSGPEAHPYSQSGQKIFRATASV